MKTDELREKYLAFFESKGCTRQASDVLVPTWDPSVLFTPAGMNPFKDHFLGKAKLDFTRATSCQKCLRTGDIENVGRTAYHHTFFEMLGNFSFGDYFKQDTIHWAWEFLTSPKWLGLDSDRLTVTVYKDDEEAYNLWHNEIRLPTSRITRMDEDENYWPASAPSLGPDGVCGPCSEIYYRQDDGQEVEIWNLVFTQFNRAGDPPDNLNPLPSQNIDTGMGLERTASVLQGTSTNYHIDILLPIVHAAAEVTGQKYEFDSETGRRLRRITDHIRASTFAVHEHVYPGPNGAKYVIRRLIRRAVLEGHQMGIETPFLHKLVDAVVETMKSAYPELSETTARVRDVICREEEAFFGTIDAGLDRISRMFETMGSEGISMVSGQQAADLYQTYGVPPELLQTLAAEKNFTFDWPGYRESMAKHADISGPIRSALFQTGPLETLKEALRETPFLGYETTTATVTIKGIITGDGHDKDDEGQLLARVEGSHQQPLRIVLDKSPFYGESGGQVGDTGRIYNDAFEFEVLDTQKHGAIIVHRGHLVRGNIQESTLVTAEVDSDRRNAIQRAHSVTHILHYALQKNVGPHAQQQGSKVDADWLRFDFTNQHALPEDVLRKIETDIHDRIHANDPIDWKIVPLIEARQAGAMMLFGEKYPDPVRMVSMGKFSHELCGGTHLAQTGEVDTFELLAEESVSAGTRRIVALTGPKAEQHRIESRDTLRRSAILLGCPVKRLPEAAGKLMATVRQLKKELSAGNTVDTTVGPAPTATGEDALTIDYSTARTLLHDTARCLNVSIFDTASRIESLQADQLRITEDLKRLATGGELSIDDLLNQGESIGEATLIVAEVPNANPNRMRVWIDQLRKQSERPLAVLLATIQGNKVLLVGGLSKALVVRGLKAGPWVGAAAKAVGGGGGGRPDFAQAGGREPDKLPTALESARNSMRQQL